MNQNRKQGKGVYRLRCRQHVDFDASTYDLFKSLPNGHSHAITNLKVHGRLPHMKSREGNTPVQTSLNGARQNSSKSGTPTRDGIEKIHDKSRPKQGHPFQNLSLHKKKKITPQTVQSRKTPSLKIPPQHLWHAH